jgi:hypothetical protein
LKRSKPVAAAREWTFAARLKRLWKKELNLGEVPEQHSARAEALPLF